MRDQFSRTELLVGEEGVEKLRNAKVAVFGVGGVGGFVCEALARAGIGSFDLFDDDLVSESNINRQIIALHSTIGQRKTEVMKNRIEDINPDAEVVAHNCFYLPANADEFPLGRYDYVVDAVDTVAAKLEIIVRADKAGVPVISAMGAGNKLDAGAFKVSDIYDTTICPLARVMRKELKKRGITKLKVVYSEETPLVPKKDFNAEKADDNPEEAAGNSVEAAGHKKRSTPGSISYAPAICGLMIAAEVIKELIEK